MTFPLVLQLIGIIVTALVLDGGVMLRCFLAGCLVHWLFFAYRSATKKPPGRIDGFLLKYGFLAFFVVVYGLVKFRR